MQLLQKVVSYNLFNCLYGIEVGGPSEIFSAIYKRCRGCDGVNWNHNTVWTGEIEAGYRYKEINLGKNFIRDAVNLSGIPDESYDFYISSNNLEHVANPVKAMREAIRVVKNGGIIEIVVPEKTYNFDHNRKSVNFAHLLEDEKNAVGEDDVSHLEEILELHDLSMDLAAGTREEFVRRSEDNINNRCLHQHVFDEKVLQELFLYLNLSDIHTSIFAGNIFAVGKK